MGSTRSYSVVFALLMVAFVVTMSNSGAQWGAEARYLPTRSDPLAPVGPPRGEDPRFDHLYDFLKELLRNAAGPGGDADSRFAAKLRNDAGQSYY